MWELWPSFAVRAPGMPADRVLSLALPETSRALDDCEAKARSADEARKSAIDLCLQRERAADPAQVPSIRKVIKRLRKDRDVEATSLDDEVQSALGEHAARARTRDAARLGARSLFEREILPARAALREAALDPIFREALAWQNLPALAFGVDKLLERDLMAQDSKTRQHERLVVRYLQRYCTKNETIGFFGPVAFGVIGGDEPIAVRAGTRFLAERRLHFEYWGIDLLAERLSEDPRLLPFLCPRRRPDIRLEGERLYFPVRQSTELEPELARALVQCTGERPANAIGDLDALEELAAGGLIFWKIELPTAGVPPEVELRRILETVEPDELRAELMAPLERLEEARAELTRAAGNASAVASAMVRLETTFTEVTGHPANRTLVYEDCRRDLEVSLGTGPTERLMHPLSLVLESARWFSHRIAEAYRSAFDELYTGPIDLVEFWSRARALFDGRIVDEARSELQRRWAEVLELEGELPIARSSAELAPRVRERFAAPHPGWPAARHHSPDLLITDDHRFVLGELHLGMNTLTNPFMLELHPEHATLRERRERELPEPCIAPVWSKARTRADFYSPSRHDLDLENGTTKSWRPRGQVLESGSLVVERIDGRLSVRTRDGARSFDIIRFVEQHLIAEAHGRFDPLPPMKHRPRVTIDELVIARESWTVERGDLELSDELDAFERFAAVRRFANLRGLPRFSFYKVPEQPKPVYLDLESPMLVDLFISQIRTTQSFVVAEMLPDPMQLWLRDGVGGPYTNELRMVAVDPDWFPFV